MGRRMEGRDLGEALGACVYGIRTEAPSHKKKKGGVSWMILKIDGASYGGAGPGGGFGHLRLWDPHGSTLRAAVESEGQRHDVGEVQSGTPHTGKQAIRHYVGVARGGPVTSTAPL